MGLFDKLFSREDNRGYLYVMEYFNTSGGKFSFYDNGEKLKAALNSNEFKTVDVQGEAKSLKAMMIYAPTEDAAKNPPFFIADSNASADTGLNIFGKTVLSDNGIEDDCCGGFYIFNKYAIEDAPDELPVGEINTSGFDIDMGEMATGDNDGDGNYRLANQLKEQLRNKISGAGALVINVDHGNGFMISAISRDSVPFSLDERLVTIALENSNQHIPHSVKFTPLSHEGQDFQMLSTIGCHGNIYEVNPVATRITFAHNPDVIHGGCLIVAGEKDSDDLFQLNEDQANTLADLFIVAFEATMHDYSHISD